VGGFVISGFIGFETGAFVGVQLAPFVGPLAIPVTAAIFAIGFSLGYEFGDIGQGVEDMTFDALQDKP